LWDPQRRRAPHQYALAEQREVGLAFGVERDELTVEYGVNGQLGKEADMVGRIPAAATTDTERALRGHDRTEPVPLQLVSVVAARRQSA
jgi:hypothetical protein